jgi:uncharacterized protein with GYD domain
MASFVVLVNQTEQGAGNMKGVPDRLQAARDAIEQAGGRMILFYLTFGQYDFVTVLEAPDAETATRVLLGIGALGNVRTTTMYAFTEAEAATILESLP